MGVELRLCAQLPTEIDIGNDTLIAEMGRNVAVGIGKVGQGSSPGCWIRDII